MTRLEGIELVPWDKGLLPEFLWIESLISFYGRLSGMHYYKMLLDVLDKYPKIKKDEVNYGMVDDFADYSGAVKAKILRENEWFVDKCILAPFGAVLKLYPQCPMAWFKKGHEDEIKALDNDDSINEVSNSVMRLFMAKDEHAGYVRALPLSRAFEHQKIKIVRNPNMEDLISALKKYPEGTHEEKYRVESFARTTVNMDIMEREGKKKTPWKWSKYFWTINSKITRCRDEWTEEAIRVSRSIETE